MGSEPRRKAKLAWWQETLVLLVLAVTMSLLVKTFLAQMFFVPSASMRPELIEDDRILVEKASTWDGEVDRGDVVVFEDPGNWLGVAPEPTGVQAFLSLVGLYPDGGHLVKRVIGIGGDKVVCCDAQGRITVNGTPLDEDYVRKGDPGTRPFEVEVPEDRVWVMGDNRANSQDSRYHQGEPGGGTVPLDKVVGRVWAIVWPASRFERLETPDTFADLEAP